MRMYAALTTGMALFFLSALILWTCTSIDALEVIIFSAIMYVCSTVLFLAATEERG